MLAAPLFPPLHKILVCDVTDDDIPAGCVNETVCVRVQLFASVIVQVYVPAINPAAVAAVPPLGDHE